MKLEINNLFMNINYSSIKLFTSKQYNNEIETHKFNMKKEEKN